MHINISKGSFRLKPIIKVKCCGRIDTSIWHTILRNYDNLALSLHYRYQKRKSFNTTVMISQINGFSKH